MFIIIIITTSELITLTPAPLCAVSCTLYHVAGVRSEMMMFSSSDLNRKSEIQCLAI